MGSYSVRMKRTASRKFFKPLPGPFSVPKRPKKNANKEEHMFVKNWDDGMGGALTISKMAAIPPEWQHPRSESRAAILKSLIAVNMHVSPKFR